MAPDVLLAFAGTGPIPWEAAAALLDDHLDGYADDARIEAILPISQATQGETEKIVHRFLTEVKISYDIVTDGTDTRLQRDIVRGARDEYEDDDPAHAVINRLVAVKQAGDAAVLIVALDAEIEPDELTRALIEEAHAHDVPVLDLTSGLMQLGQDEEEPEEAEEAEQPGDDVERSNDVESAYNLAVPILDRAQRVYNSLMLLGISTEVYQAEIDRIDEARAALARLLNTWATPPEGEPEETPQEKPQRIVRKPHTSATEEDDTAIGKPRRSRTEDETRKVVRLADGTYRAYGRGRRPAGSAVEEIPLEVYEALDLSS